MVEIYNFDVAYGQKTAYTRRHPWCRVDPQPHQLSEASEEPLSRYVALVLTRLEAVIAFLKPRLSAVVGQLGS